MKASISKMILCHYSVIVFTSGSIGAKEIGFSGDFTAVSTYIWRGIRQCQGPVLQGTVEGKFKKLSFESVLENSIWISCSLSY